MSSPQTGFQLNSALRTGAASAGTLFGLLGALSLITPDQAKDLAEQVQILNQSIFTAYGALLHMWVILGPVALIVAGYFGVKSTSVQALGAKLLKMVAHEDAGAPAAPAGGLESVHAPAPPPVDIVKAQAAVKSATTAKDVLAAIVSAAPAGPR
jgi:hypothetical protein